MYNPSLRREPLHETAAVIPVQHDTSILDWLEANGRLLARDEKDETLLEEQEEISELMGVEDSSYDDFDDDDDFVDIEE